MLDMALRKKEVRDGRIGLSWPGFYRRWKIANHSLAYVGTAGLFIAMWVTVLDVGGRTLLDKPLLGAMEISSILLVVIVSFGLSYAEELGAHIRLQLLNSRLSPKVLSISELLIYAAGFLISALVAWTTGLVAAGSVQQKEAEIAFSAIPVYPARVALAFGFSALALQFVFQIVAKWRELLHKGADE